MSHKSKMDALRRTLANERALHKVTKAHLDRAVREIKKLMEDDT